MLISDWSSDVCSSDLPLVQLRCCDGARGEAALGVAHLELVCREVEAEGRERLRQHDVERQGEGDHQVERDHHHEAAHDEIVAAEPRLDRSALRQVGFRRSEEHTSELQSLMRISYAVFCLKKKTTQKRKIHNLNTQN